MRQRHMRRLRRRKLERRILRVRRPRRMPRPPHRRWRRWHSKGRRGRRWHTKGRRGRRWHTKGRRGRQRPLRILERRGKGSGKGSGSRACHLPRIRTSFGKGHRMLTKSTALLLGDGHLRDHLPRTANIGEGEGEERGKAARERVVSMLSGRCPATVPQTPRQRKRAHRWHGRPHRRAK